MTSKDDQEFGLHRFAAVWKLRNNPNNKDIWSSLCCSVSCVSNSFWLVFGFFCFGVVFCLFVFNIKFICYVRGNLNNISGSILKLLGTCYLSGTM